MSLLNLKELAKEHKMSYSSLRVWQRLGYLKPSAMSGSRKLYSDEAFKVACELSLKGGKRIEKRQLKRRRELTMSERINIAFSA